MRETRFERNRFRRVRPVESPVADLTDEPGLEVGRSDDPTGSDTSARPVAKRRKRSAIQEVVETLILAVVIFVGVRSVVLNYRVDGASMEPNLHHGEMLIVNRRAYAHVDINSLLDKLPGISRSDGDDWYIFSPPERGDIVVLDPPVPSNEPYIKRIIGLPGETVSIHDGAVYINGQRLAEDYLRSSTNWRGFYSGEIFVEPGHVFVLGDNRNNSSDSRVFGTIPVSSIIGKAWVAYWPPSDMQILSDPAYAFE